MPQFNYSMTDGYWGCLQFLTMMNNTSLNILIYVANNVVNSQNINKVLLFIFYREENKETRRLSNAGSHKY